MTIQAQPAGYSEGYEELMEFCRHLPSPYTEHDIRAFNAILRCVYPHLRHREVRLAERLYVLMFEGLISRKATPSRNPY